MYSCDGRVVSWYTGPEFLNDVRCDDPLGTARFMRCARRWW